MAGFGLAQVGEFSFLLAQQGGAQRLMNGDVFQMFINTSILTMLATPFLIQAGPWITGRLARAVPAKEEKKDYCALAGHTIISGYGLNGRNLAKTLKATGIPYVVLEVNVDTIRRAREEGEPIIYGDITRQDVLKRAGIDCAKIIVFAISDFAATRIAVRLARQLNPSIYILIRTRYAAGVDELTKLGADQVIPEEFETSIEIFSRVLHEYHVPSNVIANQIQFVRFGGYKMLRGISLDQENLGRVAALFAGATVDTIQIEPGSPAAGRTLRDLDIRKNTGATVIAIARSEEAVTNPGPDFTLHAGRFCGSARRSCQSGQGGEFIDAKECVKVFRAGIQGHFRTRIYAEKRRSMSKRVIIKKTSIFFMRPFLFLVRKKVALQHRLKYNHVVIQLQISNLSFQ